MTDTTNSISDLIEISEDGIAFYEEAAQKVKMVRIERAGVAEEQRRSQAAVERVACGPVR